MSTTYNIECNDCKKTLWIGQSDYIYTGNKECMDKFKKFLFDHVNHNISFVDDSNEHYDYEDLTHEE